MLVALTFQVALGIGTVLTQVAIPMAATHQIGAVLLLTAVLYWIHAQTDQELSLRLVKSETDIIRRLEIASA